mmetsp:Transcript_137466/g.194520  ORF Transcript_137466/g.194520 Transcript_137466/m.194520 type:complete len:412 (-) Transcript_137466:242-1477(-)
MKGVVFFFICLVAVSNAQTIADWLAGQPRFAQWNAFATANAQINNLLTGTNQHTVFIVPDQNFPAAGSPELNAITNDANLAAQTIRLHMVDEVTQALSNPTNGVEFTTLAGERLVWGVGNGNPTIRAVNSNRVANTATLESATVVPNCCTNGQIYIVAPLLTFVDAQAATQATTVTDPLGDLRVDGECADATYERFVETRGCIDNDQLILRSRRIQRNSVMSVSFFPVRGPVDDDADNDDTTGSNIDSEDFPECDLLVQLEESAQCRLNVSRWLKGSQWRVRARIDGQDWDSRNLLTIGYMDEWDREKLFGGDYVGIVIGSLIFALILLAATIPPIMAPPTPPPAFAPDDAEIPIQTPAVVDVQPVIPAPVVLEQPPIISPPLVAPMAPPLAAAPMIMDPGLKPWAPALGF